MQGMIQNTRACGNACHNRITKAFDVRKKRMKLHCAFENHMLMIHNIIDESAKKKQLSLDSWKPKMVKENALFLGSRNF